MKPIERAREAYNRTYSGHDPALCLSGKYDWTPWIKGYVAAVEDVERQQVANA